MNSKQLQYALLLSKIRNFSQVAEKLNISQPALSKQILALEKELGVRLFDRNTNPITMTPAGEHLAQQAESLLYQQDQLQRSMERFKSGEASRLVIGITPFRSSYLMTDVLKKVNQRFPHVCVQLHEIKSEVLRRESVEGKYDFAIINLPVDETLLDVIPLEADRLWLAIPKSLLNLLPDIKEGQPLSLADCQKLPFVTVGREQEMRLLLEKLCTTAGFSPNITVEVVGLNTAWSIARAGIAATLLPMQFLNTEQCGENVLLFPLKDSAYTRQPVIVTRRGQYRSEAAQYAIELLSNRNV